MKNYVTYYNAARTHLALGKDAPIRRPVERMGCIVARKAICVGVDRLGSGPALLLMPALSSISTRGEMRPLQERLAASFATVSVDWPGFGDRPRPQVNWRPEATRHSWSTS